MATKSLQPVLHLKLRKVIRIIISLVALFYCCCPTSKCVGQQDSLSLNQLVKTWRYDTAGCKHIRSKRQAEIILTGMGIKNPNIMDFVNVFGRPDSVTKEGANQTIIYYMSSICRCGRIIDSSDKCVAQMYFNNNSFIKVRFVCQ